MERERKRREGEGDLWMKGMRLRAEPLETASSATALKEKCFCAHTYNVYVSVREGE